MTTTAPTPSPRSRWRAIHPGVRAVIVVVAAIVVVELGISALDAATRGAQPSGPTSSSLSTAHSGLAAYAELLSRYGHTVRSQRGRLASAHLDPSTTLVLLDPDRIDRTDLDNVRRFLDEGGHLVAGGTHPEWLLELAPEVLLGWSPHGARTATATDPQTGATLTVRTDGSGSWVEPGGTRALTFSPPDAQRRVVFLADASPLQNRRLGELDNAAFGLTIAGDAPRPVVFAEGVHGYGNATGLAAIPFRWKVALVAVALAALLAMVAAGRRLGPPEDEQRRLAPPRRVYVDALAATLARTRRPAETLAPLQRTIRRGLAQRAGLEPDAEPGLLRHAASGLGWPADEIEAMFVPLDDDARILAAGRALTRVHHGAMPDRRSSTERMVVR